MLTFLESRKIPTVSLKQGGGVAGKGRIAESRSRTYRRRKTHFYLHLLPTSVDAIIWTHTNSYINYKAFFFKKHFSTKIKHNQ